MVIQKARVTLASAAALFAFANLGLVASASAGEEGAQAQVAPCYGVNSCKGQGFKDLTASQCSAQHGSTTEK